MQKHSLLLVDDDRVWLRSLGEFLRMSGYDVRTAFTCGEGLALARERRPDCLLLDFHLPDADADRFCATLRSDPELKRTPVIIISADGQQEDGSYLECEADGFILKGGPLKRIHLLVESLLRRVQWERGILEKGDLRLETANLSVFRDAKPLARLSMEQFRFLFMLVDRSPSFVSEDDALKFISGTDTVPQKFDALRGLANRLRAKLGRQIGRRIKSKSSGGWIYLRPAGKEPLS